MSKNCTTCGGRSNGARHLTTYRHQAAHHYGDAVKRLRQDQLFAAVRGELEGTADRRIIDVIQHLAIQELHRRGVKLPTFTAQFAR